MQLYKTFIQSKISQERGKMVEFFKKELNLHYPYNGIIIRWNEISLQSLRPFFYPYKYSLEYVRAP